jgi:hypothetical protein
MLLKMGDKILVAHRRLFQKDEVRFFVGQVEDYEVGIVKVKGYTYVQDLMSGVIIKKPEERIKVLALSSGTLLVYQLPDAMALNRLEFRTEGERLALTDGLEFTMNLAEHMHAPRV